MIESRHSEYKLIIKGPSVYDLTNYLAANHGWVFSSVVQESFFKGHAIGYCISADPYNYEGFAISTDQTRIDYIEPIEE